MQRLLNHTQLKWFLTIVCFYISIQVQLSENYWISRYANSHQSSLRTIFVFSTQPYTIKEQKKINAIVSLGAATNRILKTAIYGIHRVKNDAAALCNLSKMAVCKAILPIAVKKWSAGAMPALIVRGAFNTLAYIGQFQHIIEAKSFFFNCAQNIKKGVATKLLKRVC